MAKVTITNSSPDEWVRVIPASNVDLAPNESVELDLLPGQINYVAVHRNQPARTDGECRPVVN